jgi:hypothetical protein
MSAPKRARDDEPAGAATGGAGGAPPPPPPPAARRRPVTRSAVYERRLKLTDVIGFVALNGYAREANACAGLCRETWRCIPAGLSAADADRVRRDHPLWQAIINLEFGEDMETRLMLAARKGDLARVRELCDWRADVDAIDALETTPLIRASWCGNSKVVRELLFRGANGNAVDIYGGTALMYGSFKSRVKVVRALLAAGADTHRVDKSGNSAVAYAGSGSVGTSPTPSPNAATILALLAAAP